MCAFKTQIHKPIRKSNKSPQVMNPLSPVLASTSLNVAAASAATAGLLNLATTAETHSAEDRDWGGRPPDPVRVVVKSGIRD